MSGSEVQVVLTTSNTVLNRQRPLGKSGSDSIAVLFSALDLPTVRQYARFGSDKVMGYLLGPRL